MALEAALVKDLVKTVRKMVAPEVKVNDRGEKEMVYALSPYTVKFLLDPSRFVLLEANILGLTYRVDPKFNLSVAGSEPEEKPMLERLFAAHLKLALRTLQEYEKLN